MHVLCSHFWDKLWQGRNGWTLFCRQRNLRMCSVNVVSTEDQDVLLTRILTCNRAETATSLEASIWVLTFLISTGGFFLLGLWLEVPISALRWGGSPGNVTGSSDITTLKQTWTKWIFQQVGYFYTIPGLQSKLCGQILFGCSFN